MTNHYTDVCEATIESLRQQLAAALAACELKDEALKRWKFDSLNMPLSEFEVIKKALAIQPDDAALKDVILCHAEPFCHLTQTSSDRNPPHGWSVTFGSGEVQLYRAWEPK